MLEGYFPILMFIAVGAAFGIAPIVSGWVVSRLVGMHRPDAQKLSPYE